MVEWHWQSEKIATPIRRQVAGAAARDAASINSLEGLSGGGPAPAPPHQASTPAPEASVPAASLGDKIRGAASAVGRGAGAAKDKAVEFVAAAGRRLGAAKYDPKGFYSGLPGDETAGTPTHEVIRASRDPAPSGSRSESGGAPAPTRRVPASSMIVPGLAAAGLGAAGLRMLTSKDDEEKKDR